MKPIDRRTRILLIVIVALVATFAAAMMTGNRQDRSTGAKKDEHVVDRIVDRLIPPKKEIVQIPAGTPIRITTDIRLSSQRNEAGDGVSGSLERDVIMHGKVVLPAGTEALGVVTQARALRKIGGRALLGFEFNLLVTPSGQEVPILARFVREGRSETGKDAATIAAGAIVGAIIGHQVEGDPEGRAIGGVLGAGVGSAIAAGTQGDIISLPAGTILELELLEPAAVQVEA